MYFEHTATFFLVFTTKNPFILLVVFEVSLLKLLRLASLSLGGFFYIQEVSLKAVFIGG